MDIDNTSAYDTEGGEFNMGLGLNVGPNIDPEKYLAHMPDAARNRAEKGDGAFREAVKQKRPAAWLLTKCFECYGIKLI